MGWDNTDTRDYALRASDPAKLKLGNPGADWLAVRGLVCLPTAAESQRQQTTGVRGRWKTGRFTWPLWTPECTRDEVRALLATHATPGASTAARARRGIATLFTCRILRTDQGGYGSVTPAAPA